MTIVARRDRVVPATLAAGDRLAPLLSGGLLALSFPPVALLVPPFLALVPILLLITGLEPGPGGRWSAARAGYRMGLVYYGVTLYWMGWALSYYSLLALPAYALAVLLLAGFTAAFAAALHFVSERTAVPFALAAALLWTATEWLQGSLPGVGFPWLGLGAALSSFPILAGAADLVGARGLAFWLALVNGFVATVMLRLRTGRPTASFIGGTMLVISLPIGYGVWRAATLELRPVATVAVVQPNIPEEIKLDRARAVDSSMVALGRLTRQIPAGSVDLVVWPEVSVPEFLEDEAAADLRSAIRELSRAVSAPILVGYYGRGSGGAGRSAAIYNSASLVDQNGPLGPRYDKRYLVPFVERVPFMHLAGLIGSEPAPRFYGGLSAGLESPVLEVAGTGYGVLICFESIFAAQARRHRLGGAGVLVNVTNDAWFGREPAHTRTTALWQHPAHLPLRAIENRMGVARSANTGLSFFVDPLGRRYEATELFVPDVRVATVYSTDAVTLFTRWGDWIGGMAAFSTVLLLLLAWTARPGRKAGLG